MARDLPDLGALRTADLFQHFGVDVDAEANERPPLIAIAAAACPRCGWWRAASDPGACPACGAPAPSRTSTPSPSPAHSGAAPTAPGEGIPPGSAAR